MTDLKTSALPVASALVGNEIVAAVQAGVLDQTTVAKIAGYAGQLTVAFVDDPQWGITAATSLGAMVDNTAALNNLVATAPAIGGGRLLLIIWGPGYYGFSSTPATIMNKSIEMAGVYGHTTPGGTTGTVLGCLNNNLTLMTLGDGTAIFFNGPRIANLGFHANGHTGCTGLLMVSVDYASIVSPSCFHLKYGIIRRMVAAAQDSAWTEIWAPKMYNIGELETATNPAGFWEDGGNDTRIYGGAISVKQPATSGTSVCIRLSGETDTTQVTQEFRCWGTKLDANANTDRATGVYWGNAKHCTVRDLPIEEIGIAYDFDGNFDASHGGWSASAGRGNFAFSGSVSNVNNVVVYRSGAREGGYDHISVEQPMTGALLTDNSNGRNYLGRFMTSASATGIGLTTNYGASKSWTPGSLATGASATTTVTVTGARVGDAVFVSPGYAVENNIIFTAWVSANDTVTIRCSNAAGTNPTNINGGAAITSAVEVRVRAILDRT